MEKVILAIGAIALLTSMVYFNQPIDELSFKVGFEQYKAKYNKKYGFTEESYRLAVYTKNMLFAKAYNAQKGNEVFGETIFFDLTDEEFAATYLTL